MTKRDGKQILSEEDLEPGDLLLCYSPELQGADEEVRAGYSHVAIQGHKSGIVESNSAGVRSTTVESLLEEYGHLAVLRAQNTWSTQRISLLDQFLQSQCGKPFNSIGMYKVPMRKEAHRDASMDKVRGYFESTEDPPPDERGAYFCSELITSAFIKVGIIQESASVLLTPDIFSPEGLAADKCFGYFIGYIVPSTDYVIPHDDHFKKSI